MWSGTESDPESFFPAEVLCTAKPFLWRMLVNVVCICKSRGVDQATCLGAIAFRGFTVVVVTTKSRFGCLALPDFCSSPYDFRQSFCGRGLMAFYWPTECMAVQRAVSGSSCAFLCPKSRESLQSLIHSESFWREMLDQLVLFFTAMGSLGQGLPMLFQQEVMLEMLEEKEKRHWATQVLLAGAWWAIKAVYMSSWQLSVWWVHYSTRFENASLSMSFSSFTISRLFSIIVECGM